MDDLGRSLNTSLNAAFDGGSFRNDPVLKRQYDNFRSKYWRWRAKQIDKSEL